MLDQINIQDIIKIAKDAGKAIMKIYNQNFDVEYKSDSSPLTIADIKANEIIVTALNQLSVNSFLHQNIPILSEEGRSIPYDENIRRIGEVTKLMMKAGLIVMTAFISPFKEDRIAVRNLIPNGDFIEIYCKASLETCEARDVKGLYKRARAGEIKNYTGIDSPYEVPDNPELIIDTDKETLDVSVSRIVSFLQTKAIFR
jgi:adenylyl-sulfate kinase